MSSGLPEVIGRMREAQRRWRERPLAERAAAMGRVRALVAREGEALGKAAGEPRGRALVETLTAEVIPLAAACQFLQREGARWLRPRHLGKAGRPVWLAGVRSEVRREPYGVVLVVGPANYPLLLPGVQALQALMAGNGVLLKPGRQGYPAAAALAALCEEAGLPRELLQVLPEEVEQVHAALRAGVDLVVFTGSTAAGKAVLAAAAEVAVPVIAELSGEDPYVVREDADLDLAARALEFGTKLNAGNSCIAPRQVIAVGRAGAGMHERAAGLAVTAVRDDDEALREAGRSSYALGATIMSRDVSAARRLAERLEAGVVTINDCIMPTADPRLPFGGSKASGFGVTRGAEGLLALTRPKVIIEQRGPWRHLEPVQPGDETFFLAYLRAAHGAGWRGRLSAVRDLCHALRARFRNKR